MKPKVRIGRAEYAWLIDANLKKVPARIDTGARTSSLWASDIYVTNAGLQFKLFGPASEFYTGEVLTQKQYSKIVVASSTGHTQERYKIPMTIQIRNRRIKTFITLTDRSTQAFPMLIGRNTLRGKFVVDVQYGPRTLDALDQARYNELQSLS